MLLGGLFRPRLEWFAGAAFDPRPILFYGGLVAFVLGLSAAYLCGLEGRSYRMLGLAFDGAWLRQASAGAAWGAGVISFTTLLLVGARAADIPAVARGPLAHLLSLVAFLLLAAAFEELVFRGYGFQCIAEGFTPAAAAVLSSVLFGLAHYGNPQATLLSTLNTALAGVLLAIVRVRTGALWMPIGLHFGWNLFLGPVFSFPVSGYRFGAAPLSASAPGLVWFSGGGYGPEGGAALTAVLILTIPLALRVPAPAASSSLRSDSGVD